MMKKQILSIALISAICICSCKKATLLETANDGKAPTSTNDIKVPTGFAWATSSNVNFTVNVTDARFANSIHIISIYVGDPSNGGLLIAKGSASLGTAFKCKLSVDKQVKQVYIIKTSPDNSSTTQQVQVSSTDLSASFGF